MDPNPTKKWRIQSLLISNAFRLELVEASLPDLGSCATPVVPELGGKADEKPPSHRSSSVPPRSVVNPPEVLAAPSDAARHLAESSLLLWGLRRENN